MTGISALEVVSTSCLSFFSLGGSTNDKESRSTTIAISRQGTEEGAACCGTVVVTWVVVVGASSNSATTGPRAG